MRKDNEKSRAYGDSDRQQNERTPWKCFRYVSIYHLINKCSKPPNDNDKQLNQVRFNKRGNYSSQKESKNGDNDNDQYIYMHLWH